MISPNTTFPSHKKKKKKSKRKQTNLCFLLPLPSKFVFQILMLCASLLSQLNRSLLPCCSLITGAEWLNWDVGQTQGEVARLAKHEAEEARGGGTAIGGGWWWFFSPFWYFLSHCSLMKTNRKWRCGSRNWLKLLQWEQEGKAVLGEPCRQYLEIFCWE